MKHTLGLTFAILLIIAPTAQSQKTVFGPHTIDDGRQILIDGTCKYWVHRPGAHYPPYSPWTLFRENDTLQDKEARFISDWIIPQDSTMSPDNPLSVTLRLEYFGHNLPNLSVDVWAFTTLSQYMNDNTVFSEMTGAPLFSANGSNGILKYTDSSGAFLNQVKNAVSVGQLTLAFALPDVGYLHGHEYLVDSSSIQLTIQFQDSYNITITNVVNDIRDWDLESKSRVRGDQNLYTGIYADYTQLPHFEPAVATRSWDVLHYHLTETWFARFEHASLNGYRHKFRHWNRADQSYKVAQHTELFTGLVTDFRAISDTAYQARNLVKREITSPYSGLSFDFKDPWRV